MSLPPLSLQNVSKAFAGKAAVSDVSFTIPQGKIIGFLGPNGAGKTTSLRMALGLIKPDSGSIALFGQEPGPSSFGRIGFLPEERGLYKKQTARESIAHMARLNGMAKRDAFIRADDLLERYGLGDVRKKKNKDMSKGMAQKIQLLGAIAHDPEFYILDEPFSGLDPVNQNILEDIVRGIAARGATIIFSTHVMEHAERLCDKIILLSGGEKIFDGSTQEALSKVPRRLIISSENAELKRAVTRFCHHIEVENGVLNLTLRKDIEAQFVLEELVAKKIKLTRFEPKAASLHEAFVTLVDVHGSDRAHEHISEGEDRQ